MTSLHVAVFVGTRADLSPLGPVVTQLASTPGVEVTLLTGVAFSAAQLDAALAAEGVGAGLRIISLAPPLADVSELALAAQGAAIAAGASDFLAQHPADVAVILGDRWELLFVVPTFFLAKIPVVHLHGGEVTEGALDDRVRHAVSKLADQHCAASRGSVARLQQMGEPQDRIHLTGAPGLDRLHHVRPLEDDELEALLSTSVERPLALFTYHPALGDVAATSRWADEALGATLDTCGTVVATYPGFDTGREAVIDVLLRAAEGHPNLILREQLGAAYPQLLASCDVVVGNSSSGIIEAPSVGIPSVDIGARQSGRERSSMVTHCAEGRDAVARAVESVLRRPPTPNGPDPFDPYRDGRAAGRIRDVVLEAAGGDRRKAFVDLDGRSL